MTAAFQHRTTGPAHLSGSRFASCRHAQRFRNTRPAKRVAGQKTASRNFFRAPPKPRRENRSQVTGTHLESRTYRYVFVSGCVVAPDSAATGGGVGFYQRRLESQPGDWFYPGRNPGESFLAFAGRSIVNTLANPSFQNAMAFGGPGSNFGGALNQNLTLEESFSVTPKITKQMGSRGWDTAAIDDTIQAPSSTSPATNKATGAGATAYFNSDGSYVVRDNATGTIIQISNRNDPNWVPDPTIQNPPPKH